MVFQQFSFACKWIIDGNIIRNTSSPYLRSSLFYFPSIPGTQCFIQWDLRKDINKTRLSFVMIFPKKFCYEEEMYYIDYIFTIGNFSSPFSASHISFFLTKDYPWAGTTIKILPFVDLFDKENYLIDDNGKFEIKLCGTFTFGNEPYLGSFDYIDFSSKNKDNFSILIGKLVLKVNLEHLGKFSSYFADLNKSSGSKEWIEKKLEITEFSYEIVKAATDFCNGKKMSKVFMEQNLDELFAFANFYHFNILKDYLNANFKITKTNIVETSALAFKLDSKHLQNRCINFILRTSIQLDFIELFDKKLQNKINELFVISEEVASVENLFPMERFIERWSSIFEKEPKLLFSEFYEFDLIKNDCSALVENDLAEIKNDFSIICGEHDLEINLEHLAKFSSYFAGLNENKWKEKIKMKLSITEFPYEIVKVAIDFCYGKQISMSFLKENFSKLMEFADYYLIDALKNADFEISHRNLPEMYKLSLKFNAKKLRIRCIYFVFKNRLCFGFINCRYNGKVPIENLRNNYTFLCNVYHL